MIKLVLHTARIEVIYRKKPGDLVITNNTYKNIGFNAIEVIQLGLFLQRWLFYNEVLAWVGYQPLKAARHRPGVSIKGYTLVLDPKESKRTYMSSISIHRPEARALYNFIREEVNA